MFVVVQSIDLVANSEKVEANSSTCTFHCRYWDNLSLRTHHVKSGCFQSPLEINDGPLPAITICTIFVFFKWLSDRALGRPDISSPAVGLQDNLHLE